MGRVRYDTTWDGLLGTKRDGSTFERGVVIGSGQRRLDAEPFNGFVENVILQVHPLCKDPWSNSASLFRLK